MGKNRLISEEPHPFEDRNVTSSSKIWMEALNYHTGLSKFAFNWTDDKQGEEGHTIIHLVNALSGVGLHVDIVFFCEGSKAFE